jgi:hypothetical protein
VCLVAVNVLCCWFNKERHQHTTEKKNISTLKIYNTIEYETEGPGGKVNILGDHSIGHSKQKLYMYMCPIPKGFSFIELFHSTVHVQATRHVFTRVANCIDVDGGIFGNVLY